MGRGTVGAGMAVREGGRRHPLVERLLVAPARDDEPLQAIIGGTEQLEALEAVLIVDGPGPRLREAAEALRWLSGGVPELAGKILTYDGAASGRIRALEVNPRAGCACGAARSAENAATSGPERNQSRNQ